MSLCIHKFTFQGLTGPYWLARNSILHSLLLITYYWIQNFKFLTCCLERPQIAHNTSLLLVVTLVLSYKKQYKTSGQQEVLSSVHPKLKLLMEILIPLIQFNWLFHDTHLWQIWSYTAQNKFCQKFPLAGFELTTSGSSVWCSDNWASKEYVGNFLSELSFVSCTSSHVGLCLFLESIEHDYIKVLISHPQPNSDLAHLAEH